MNNTCFTSIVNKKIAYICNNEYNYFLSKNNVLGIGLGYKITKGFNTYEKCIKVFTKKKMPLNLIHTKDLIPTIYKGFKTDVVESGIIKANSFNKKIRPVQLGYNIGVALNKAQGTLCCIVKDISNYYILSCNHVLALENTAPINSPITQPSFLNHGNPLTDTIAYLYKYIPLDFSFKGISLSDCAIAKINNPSLVSNHIATLGPILGITPPSLDLSIRKIGKTSEITYGNITATHVTIRCAYNTGYTIFKNQLAANAITKEGDSGALLADLKNNAIGMLIGGNLGSLSIYSPITLILDLLKVNLVTSNRIPLRKI
ncbi:hypothetical protein [Clostridium sp. K25]|uniref:hypothetical protein n=1 Tax=Clostridium sp. K25 TaxID=1443109 RepID=UPI00057D80E6|nr:hypothetical protein [Clostridium sp. K25]